VGKEYLAQLLLIKAGSNIIADGDIGPRTLAAFKDVDQEVKLLISHMWLPNMMADYPFPTITKGDNHG
jgi:lysozyme family protein